MAAKGDRTSAEECNIGKNECVDELIDDYFSDFLHCESLNDSSSSDSDCSSISDIEFEAEAELSDTDVDDSAVVCDVDPYNDYKQVSNFSCGCKINPDYCPPAPSSSGSSPSCRASSCLLQWSLDDVVARRLNMAEFSEGLYTIYIQTCVC